MESSFWLKYISKLYFNLIFNFLIFMQVNEFQHTKINFFEDGSTYISCSCQTFNIGNEFTEESGPLSNCCHSRLLKDLLEPERNPYINNEKVMNGRLQSNYPVVPLPSKRDTEKFSVIGSDSSISFVSTYSVNSRSMIQCHTGRCKLRYGKVRKFTSLSSSNICVHLEEVRKYKNIPESDGVINDGDVGTKYFKIPVEKVNIFNLN